MARTIILHQSRTLHMQLTIFSISKYCGHSGLFLFVFLSFCSQSSLRVFASPHINTLNLLLVFDELNWSMRGVYISGSIWHNWQSYLGSLRTYPYVDLPWGKSKGRGTTTQLPKLPRRLWESVSERESTTRWPQSPLSTQSSMAGTWGSKQYGNKWTFVELFHWRNMQKCILDSSIEWIRTIYRITCFYQYSLNGAWPWVMFSEISAHAKAMWWSGSEFLVFLGAKWNECSKCLPWTSELRRVASDRQIWCSRRNVDKHTMQA